MVRPVAPQAYPGIPPGVHPGAYPGIPPGVHPGAYPGGHPGAFPGAHPGVHPGVIPGAHPGAHPGQHGFPHKPPLDEDEIKRLQLMYEIRKTASIILVVVSLLVFAFALVTFCVIFFTEATGDIPHKWIKGIVTNETIRALQLNPEKIKNIAGVVQSFVTGSCRLLLGYASVQGGIAFISVSSMVRQSKIHAWLGIIGNVLTFILAIYFTRGFPIAAQCMIKDSAFETLKYYSKSNDSGVVEMWDVFQMEFQCCGVDNGSDWRRTATTFLKEHNDTKGEWYYPHSCCKFRDGASFCDHKLDYDSYYNSGCRSQIKIITVIKMIKAIIIFSNLFNLLSVVALGLLLMYSS